MTRIYEGIWENKMTYKTRQEVLRAAADWMDVCEKAGVEATCKVCGIFRFLSHVGLCSTTHELDASPENYEFPIALLEGKEVWVGSELYGLISEKWHIIDRDLFFGTHIKNWSWNPPKPKTVTLTANYKDVEACANTGMLPIGLYDSCKQKMGELK